MSTTTQENTRPRNRQNAEPASPPAATPAAEAAPTSVTLEIADLQVTLPVKFGPGHVLTENQAKVLDAAYQRQFTNNQNASAKSRAEAYAKATTDEERKAKAPLTAAEIAALYTDYEPNVGGTPRQSVMEKLRLDAAWRAWVSLVTEHNDAVAKGGAPIIVKAGKNAVQLFSGKGAAEKREALSAQLLTLPQYASRIQSQLDAIMAERGTKKAEATETVVASGADLL